MAGGEAGREAILPLKGFYEQLEDILSTRLNTSAMEKYLAIIADNSSKGIYLEDGTLVGHLLPAIDGGPGADTKTAKEAEPVKPDITLNGISMNGIGWLRESASFPPSQSQTNTIVVPGRNSPIRYTEALGRVSYQPRSFQITLSMLGDRIKFNEMISRTVNRLAGRLAKVVLSEEPELYYIGTIQMESPMRP